jgi:hypothetical protein
MALGLALGLALGATRPAGAVETATRPGAQAVAGSDAAAGKSARALAFAQAKFDWCSKADAADAGKVEAQLKSLEHKSGRDEVARWRKSDDYRKAYDAETAFLGNVDPHNAARVCAPKVPGARAK